MFSILQDIAEAAKNLLDKVDVCPILASFPTRRTLPDVVACASENLRHLWDQTAPGGVLAPLFDQTQAGAIVIPPPEQLVDPENVETFNAFLVYAADIFLHNVQQ